MPLTHPDKLLFPADGISKADLAAEIQRRLAHAREGSALRRVEIELGHARLRADSYTLSTLPARLEHTPDPWAGIARHARALPPL